MNTIKFEEIEGIVYLTFNRPEVFNSFNRLMSLTLLDYLDQCQNNSDIRVVVITGNGKAFCAGQDLKEATDPALNPGFKKILEEHYNPIIRKIRSLNKPVIAAVNGVAAGAGANIALACDLTIASSSASFIQAFSKIGLIPDSGGTYFLPRLIGFQKATALMMLGEKIDAKEAERIGMIYRCINADEFQDEIKIIATKLRNMPTKALSFIKELLNKSMNSTLEKQLELESMFQIKASETNDYKEGVNAFVSKRVPEFKGN